jgi:hypothetical protein
MGTGPDYGSAFLAICLGVVLLAAYFLPSIIGWNKRNLSAIFWLNFLVGWTFIGWIVALIWALTKEPNTAAAKPAEVLCGACGRYSTPGTRFCGSCGAQLA